MKKSKKNLRGMTLFEMIISIAIFAVMGGLLILIGTHIDRTTKASTNLKNKVVKESPYAANHITKYAYGGGAEVDLPASSIEVKVALPGESGDYYVYKDPTDPSKGFDKKSYSDPQVAIDAKKYATEDIVLDGVSDAEKKRIQEGPNNGLNLEFIEFEPLPAGP